MEVIDERETENLRKKDKRGEEKICIYSNIKKRKKKEKNNAFLIKDLSTI